MRRPIQGREPVGYHRKFLDDYIPNQTAYLPDDISVHLHNIGQLKKPDEAVGGTYPPDMVDRLLIDLSWASSRLEGNTYSLLETRNLIEAPFEQSFFTMAHLPYLQPFTDVNKRTARLGANIPLIKNRLCPLSFVGVPAKEYIEGMLGVYELNETGLLARYRLRPKEFEVWKQL